MPLLPRPRRNHRRRAETDRATGQLPRYPPDSVRVTEAHTLFSLFTAAWCRPPLPAVDTRSAGAVA